jgi:hypothetical protein
MARNRLRLGEALAAVCGGLLFVDMFLPWYEIGGSLPPYLRDTLHSLAAASGVDLERNAWQAFTVIDIVLMLTVLAAVGLAALILTQRSVALPVAASVMVTALGAVATILVLYRIVEVPGFVLSSRSIPDRVIDVRLWAYVGLALCAGIAAGGFLSMADEGQRLADAEGIPLETRPAPSAK